MDLPETYTLVTNVNSSDTCFTIKSNNVTLDGAGYTINYSQIGNGYGINNTGGWDNITIKNLNIVQDNSAAAGGTNHAISALGMVTSNITNNTIITKDTSAFGIDLESSSSSNILTNNTITTTNGGGDGIRIISGNQNTLDNNTITTLGSSAVAINMVSSNLNNISNNTITTNTSSIYSYGIYLRQSDTNTLSNNNIRTLGVWSFGLTIDTGSSDNVVTGGSVVGREGAYYIGSGDASNNVTNTNFTAVRNITIEGYGSWFNYRNDSSQNIWLKTNFSLFANGSVNRTLLTWSNSTMRWNDTNGTAGLTARYNITGLIPSTTYVIYNTTGSTSTRTLSATDSAGILPSFTIDLSANTQIQVQALNLTSCGDLDLPETYTLVTNVNSSDTCFTIKSNNVTLDGAGYTINYSQIGNGYGINNTGGWDNITIKNLNIVQDNSAAAGGTNHAISALGMVTSNITNNTIITKDTSAFGIDLESSSSSNILTNNTITTTNGGGDGIRIISGNQNTLDNNTITTLGSSAVAINMVSSNLNNISNNTITTNTSSIYSYGIYLRQSDTNTLSNNNIRTLGVWSFGLTIDTGSSDNVVTGGSVVGREGAYYIGSGDASNNVTNTNFTAVRNITIEGYGSWFNYRNDSSQNIWLKTNFSLFANGSVNRTLVNWNTIVMRWNETNGTVGLTARYNITGMLPSTTYYIYNTSQGVQSTSYTLTADANGNLPSFTIALNGNTEIAVGTPTMVSTTASNSNWTWNLPFTGDKIRLGNAVNWIWTTFNNSGSGWTIPRGSAANWTWA